MQACGSRTGTAGPDRSRKDHMARDSTHETLPVAPDAPNFDWREWLSFVGSVLGTALVVSVVLGGVVLLLSAAS